MLSLTLGIGIRAAPMVLAPPATFTLTLTGLADGEARPGNQSAIGYTKTPAGGTDVVAWGIAPGDSTYGTGPQPTDYTAGAGGALCLSVTSDGTTVTTSAPIRYAAPVASGALPDIVQMAGVSTPIAVAADFSFAGTPRFTLETAPSGLTINPDTGVIDASAVTEVAAVPVVVRLADANEPSRFAESAFALTIEVLQISQTVDGELEINAGTGLITFTVTAPPTYANYDAGDGPGVFIFDPADLNLGPVNLVPPQILNTGSVAADDTLTTDPGLWIYEGANGGLTPPTLQWEADTLGDGNFSPIPGATAGNYTLSPDESGDSVRVQETLADAAGARVAASSAISVTSAGPTVLLSDSFAAADGYALNDDIPATSANWQTLFATDAQIAANITPLGIARITRSAASKNIRIAYAGAVAEDQAIEIVIDEIVRNNRADPTFTLRASGTGLDETGFRMFFRTISNELYINEFSGGGSVQSQIIGGISPAAGDVIRAEIAGGTAEVFVNGVSVATMSGIAISGGAPAWGAFLGNNGSDAVALRSVQIEDLS